MKRESWGFEYSADELAQAAAKKRDYHQERFDWWKNKKEQVISHIRADGLEVDEKIVFEHRLIKSRDWDRGAQVMVRDDLSKDLAECLEKLSFHTALINDYDGWYQVLMANKSAKLALDHDDWLFFFGQAH
jgi:hypothetical protein